MRIGCLIGPPISYLGPRTLAAFLSVLALAIVLYLTGVMMSETTLKGVGVARHRCSRWSRSPAALADLR